MFGTPLPGEYQCGNCNSQNTVSYNPPCCVAAEIQEAVLDDRTERTADDIYKHSYERGGSAAITECKREEDLRAAEQAKKEVKLREQVRKEAMRFAFEEAAAIADEDYYTAAQRIRWKIKEIT
jgi:hypothetical protein